MSLLSLVREYVRVYWQDCRPMNCQPAPVCPWLAWQRVMPSPEDYAENLLREYRPSHIGRAEFIERVSGAIRRSL
jgi:hypothetical protein